MQRGVISIFGFALYFSPFVDGSPFFIMGKVSYNRIETVLQGKKNHRSSSLGTWCSLNCSGKFWKEMYLIACCTKGMIISYTLTNHIIVFKPARSRSRLSKISVRLFKIRALKFKGTFSRQCTPFYTCFSHFSFLIPEEWLR